jgi:hypothetical protein
MHKMPAVHGTLSDAILSDPEIRFSSWVTWEQRGVFAQLTIPGVYLLAHLATTLTGPADPLTREIVYVGETGALHTRLGQFNTVALAGHGNHSGARAYYKEFKFRPPLKGLSVAVLPMALDGAWNHRQGTAFRKYIERKLIWQYAAKWGDMPICNRE